MQRKVIKLSRKKSIIITAIIFIASVLLIAFGIWGGMLRSAAYKSHNVFYPTKVTDDDIGKKYRIANIEGALDAMTDSFYLLVITDPDVTEENYTSFWFGLDMQKVGTQEADMLLTAAGEYEECYVTGILRKYDKAYEQKIKSSLESWVEDYYDSNEELIKGILGGISREKIIENELSAFASYYFEVTDVLIPKPFNGTAYIVSGAVILFSALLFEICFVFKLKKRKVIPSACRKTAICPRSGLLKSVFCLSLR